MTLYPWMSPPCWPIGGGFHDTLIPEDDNGEHDTLVGCDSGTKTEQNNKKWKKLVCTICDKEREVERFSESCLPPSSVVADTGGEDGPAATALNARTRTS